MASGVTYTSRELALAQAIVDEMIARGVGLGGGGGGDGGGGGGDASAFNQALEIARLETIRDKLPEALANGRLIVDNSQVTQPISATALPLPTDGANATNQTTEITLLTSVRDRLPTTVGVKSAALSLPVTLSNDGAFATNFGATTDTAATSDTGSFSFLQFIKRLLSIKLPATLGAKTAAQSFPVTLSSDGAFSSSFGGTTDTVATTDTGSFSFLQFIKRLLSVKLPSTVVGDRFKTDSLVRTTLRKWREDFAGVALDSTAWTVVQTGAGQSISVTNSILTIASGTTALSETIIRTAETFTIPFKTAFIANASQRIVNQEFVLEIVDPTGLHYATWLFDGTGTTVAKAFTANSGSSSGVAGATVSNTVNNQTLEIETGLDEIYFYTRAVDSNAVRSPQVVRSRQIPDPNLQYHVQIRVRNLATAPLSNTNLNVDSVTIQDIEEVAVEVTGGRGGGAANQSIPVTAPTALAITNGSISTPLNVNDYLAGVTETALTLIANAVYLGGARDSGNTKNLVRGWVLTDVPGTLIFEQSLAGSIFRQTDIISISGNATQATRYEFKLAARYYRIRYTNGATAQTIMDLISTPVNIGA